jgi:hypothetical protein
MCPDSDGALVRPELVSLGPAAKERVRAEIEVQGGYCESCGAKDFDIGRVLYLGFLFLDADNDAYLIALTCRNPDCPKPRSAIMLPEKAFLVSYDGRARAATWSAGAPDDV